MAKKKEVRKEEENVEEVPEEEKVEATEEEVEEKPVENMEEILEKLYDIFDDLSQATSKAKKVLSELTAKAEAAEAVRNEIEEVVTDGVQAIVEAGTTVIKGIREIVKEVLELPWEAYLRADRARYGAPKKAEVSPKGTEITISEDLIRRLRPARRILGYEKGKTEVKEETVKAEEVKKSEELTETETPRDAVETKKDVAGEENPLRDIVKGILSGEIKSQGELLEKLKEKINIGGA